MIEKPIKGQKLYSLNVGNAARHSKQKLTEVEVTKVGRKYFTCCPKNGSRWQETQYYLDDWHEKTECSANSVLYKNPQEWEDEKEEYILCKTIGDSFRYGKNNKKAPLSILREIKKLIEG